MTMTSPAPGILSNGLLFGRLAGMFFLSVSVVGPRGREEEALLDL